MGKKDDQKGWCKRVEIKKKMKFWLPEALDNCLLDIVEQFD